MKHEWQDLPASVRAAVTEKLGSSVLATSYPAKGRSSDLSITVETRQGPVFLKGIQVGDRRVRMHRNEAKVNGILPDLAPRVLWEIETDGWLVLGYEHVTGRYADFSPGSPDLPLLANAVSTLAVELTPSPVAVDSLAVRWAKVSPWKRLAGTPETLDDWETKNIVSLLKLESQAIGQMDGPGLIHSDIHQYNVIIGDRLRLIDWAWSCAGPRWADSAFLVLRLIGAGHTPKQAESWAGQIAAWQESTERERVAFSAAVLGMWRYRKHFPELIGAARNYVRYLTEK
ncbi:phosphotransferase [Amycolatopsis sp. NPDC059027]|uniref:phosphotransferase n=1 Tax=unclassified Amycolatopsis TaxID=2618356 RepID=UPI00366A6B2A